MASQPAHTFASEVKKTALHKAVHTLRKVLKGPQTKADHIN